MSHVPATISTTPAQRRSPKAISVAAAKVNSSPTTVTWFGVKGTRPRADINASALRRTHTSNRVVNIALLAQPRCEPCGLARLLVNLYHLRRDCVPGISPRLLMPIGAHAVAQLGIPRQDDQSHSELGPPLGGDGQSAAAGLEGRLRARDRRG